MDKPFTVTSTQTLTIEDGVIMTLNANIENNGQIIQKIGGTITGSGQITGNPVMVETPPVEEPSESESEGLDSLKNRYEDVKDGLSEEEQAVLDQLFDAADEALANGDAKELDRLLNIIRELLDSLISGRDEPYLPSTPISDGIHEYSLGKMLYIDGKRVKGLYEYDGATYYFDEKGFMQTGWVEFDNGWRYFAEDGKMVAGWLQIGNAWYYLDPETGIMYDDGLRTIGKSTYYFYDWGGMASDWWYEAEDGWYFFGGSGAMKSAQWLQWKGHWYYLTESGKMAVGTDIGGYYVDASGVWIP